MDLRTERLHGLVLGISLSAASSCPDSHWMEKRARLPEGGEEEDEKEEQNAAS